MDKKYITQTLFLLLSIFCTTIVNGQCIEDSHSSLKIKVGHLAKLQKVPIKPEVKAIGYNMILVVNIN